MLPALGAKELIADAAILTHYADGGARRDHCVRCREGLVARTWLDLTMETE